MMVALMETISLLPHTYRALVVATLAAVVLYSISLAVYRVWFHPLSKFPGPKLAAITRYYELYYDVIKDGQYTFKIGELHKKYGSIIRISPYELHVNDPDFYEKLYRQDGRWEKYDFAYNALGMPGAGIATIDHEKHRMRRAASNPFFSRQKILRLQPLIQGHIEKLRRRILDFAETGKVLRLESAYPAFTMDVITDYAMGESTGNLDHEDFNHEMADCTKGFGRVWHISKHVSGVMWLFQHTPTSIVQMLDPMAGRWKQFVETCFTQIRNVQKAAQNGSLDSKSHRTIFHELLNHSTLPASEKTERRMVDEAVNFVSAGTETTGRTLRVLTYHLCSNPDILQKLRRELKNVSSSPSDPPPTLEQLEKLPYLHAVLTEGLRLSYGASSRLARIAPDRALRYADWEIPSGVPVGMSNVLIAQNEAIFPAARTFQPERWTDPADRRRLERYFQPFSRGTRNCLGLNLAWVELFLVTAMLVTNFDFTLYETTAAEIEIAFDHFIPGVKGKNGMRVTVKRAGSD